MTREMFRPDKQPEPSEISSQREQKFRAEYKMPDMRWSIPKEEFDAILAAVNFPELRKIFTDIARRSGMSDGQINFREINDVYQFDNPLMEACFIPEGNVICLQGRALKETTKALKEKYVDLPSYEILLKLRTLELIIHEQVHAVSYMKFENWDESMVKRDSFRQEKATPGMYRNTQSGYHHLIYTPSPEDKTHSDRDSIFIGFDEGVTEKLAQEILQKYLSLDNSISGEDVKTYFQLKEKYGREMNPYSGLVNLVEAVVEKIAQNSGLEKETVWQAITRSKLEGADLQDADLGRSINEHTFDGFTERLKLLGYQNRDIESCIQELREKS